MKNMKYFQMMISAFFFFTTFILSESLSFGADAQKHGVLATDTGTKSASAKASSANSNSRVTVGRRLASDTKDAFDEVEVTLFNISESFLDHEAYLPRFIKVRSKRGEILVSRMYVSTYRTRGKGYEGKFLNEPFYFDNENKNNAFLACENRQLYTSRNREKFLEKPGLGLGIGKNRDGADPYEKNTTLKFSEIEKHYPQVARQIRLSFAMVFGEPYLSSLSEDDRAFLEYANSEQTTAADLMRESHIGIATFHPFVKQLLKLQSTINK